jgi:hypothetical protein
VRFDPPNGQPGNKLGGPRRGSIAPSNRGSGPSDLEVPDEPPGEARTLERALPAAGDCSHAQHTVFDPGGQTKRLELKKLP